MKIVAAWLANHAISSDSQSARVYCHTAGFRELILEGGRCGRHRGKMASKGIVSLCTTNVIHTYLMGSELRPGSAGVNKEASLS